MSSKRYKKLPTKTSQLKALPFKDTIANVKKNCTTKFDESIDLSLRINNKQKKNEISLRTVINLPSGSGKKIKVGVVCEENKIKVAKDAGADVYGGDDLVDKIKDGKIDFEKLICTPSMMVKLSKLGKVLGPKGLMPNPKLGTVSNDIVKSVKEIKNGLVEIRNDKDGNLASTIGRKSYSTEKNAKLLESLIKSTTVEGDMILDPFAGSGVTGAEATKAGRKSYSIEKNKDVAENITKPRIKKEVKQEQQKKKESEQQLEEDLETEPQSDSESSMAPSSSQTITNYITVMVCVCKMLIGTHTLLDTAVLSGVSRWYPG
mgnify:CR=1 FL=1